MKRLRAWAGCAIFRRLATGSADAAINLPALSPGAYTVPADSVDPQVGGEVLLEVYLRP